MSLPRQQLNASAARGDGWGWPQYPAWVEAPSRLEHNFWTRIPSQQDITSMPPYHIPWPFSPGPFSTFYRPPEQEWSPRPGPGVQILTPQWMRSSQYGNSDCLYPANAELSGRPLSPGALAETTWEQPYPEWLRDDATDDGTVSELSDAVALDDSDEPQSDDEQESMLRVERDGPPRSKWSETEVQNDALVIESDILRRSDSRYDGGDSATFSNQTSPRTTAPTITPTTRPTPLPPAPSLEAEWTLWSKAERPEEEDDFVRCQQLSRCSDRPPCPSCLCFLCSGCSGTSCGGKEAAASPTTVDHQPTSGSALTGASASAAVSRPRTAPATVRNT